MKIFLVVTLALQLVSADYFYRDSSEEFHELDFDESEEIFIPQKTDSCKYYTEDSNTVWPWPNKKVAHCDNIVLPDPDDVPADTQVLYITAGKNLAKLEEDAFKTYTKLTDIYIERGTLEQIDIQAFRNMASTVTTISFWNNLLTEIPTGLYSNEFAPNVVTIKLCKNKLRYLQKNLFSNLKFVKSIELYDNEISLIEDNTFFNLPSLEELHLYNNKLHSLSFNMMDTMSTSLRYLPLDGNPWNCKESMCKFMAFVNTRQLWGDRPAPTCSTPGTVRGKAWNQIHQEIMSLSFTPNSMSVFEKDNFTLECKHCFASQLRWTFDGRELPINYQQISEDSQTSKLTIENVHKNQQGEYRCYVKNCEDCDVAGLYLEVKEQPHQKFDWNQVPQLSYLNKMSPGYLILLPNSANSNIEENYVNNKVVQESQEDVYQLLRRNYRKGWQKYMNKLTEGIN